MPHPILAGLVLGMLAAALPAAPGGALASSLNDEESPSATAAPAEASPIPAGSAETPDSQPATPEIDDEDESDCDDCVLAKTLWGLLWVARPRRLPRPFIAGVTVA